jgi:hypothetical protein
MASWSLGVPGADGLPPGDHAVESSFCMVGERGRDPGAELGPEALSCFSDDMVLASLPRQGERAMENRVKEI